MGHPVVVHPLCILGVSHQSTDVQTAIYLKFIANNANNRYPLAYPLALLKDFVAIDLAIAHLGAVRFTGFQRFAVKRLQLLVFRRPSKGRSVAGVQIQRSAVIVDVVVVGNANRVLIQPVANRLIAHTERLQGCNGCRIGVHALVLISGQVFRHKTILGVCASRVLHGWIHVHRERITNPANLDVLVKRVVVAILSQQPDVALTIGNLVLAGGVIGNISVRDVLNVPNHAVKNLGNLHIGIAIHRNHLGAGTVLPLVIGDLANVLRQLINSQCRTSIDRLPLHRPTGSQHISRPLPAVVRTSSVELQVVVLILTRF